MSVSDSCYHKTVMAVTKRRTIIDLLLLVIVVISGIFAILNAQSVGDWYHFLRYEPPDEIVQLAEKSGMNDTGKRLFYRFSPRYVDPPTLNEHCLKHTLGCTVGNSIYILEAGNPLEINRSAVTAAHEMLHVAYDRLPTADKEQLKIMLDKQIADLKSTKTVERFINLSDDEFHNEAHSYLGTEQLVLNPELEEHYSKYFSDRQKAVSAYKVSPEN